MGLRTARMAEDTAPGRSRSETPAASLVPATVGIGSPHASSSRRAATPPIPSSPPKTKPLLPPPAPRLQSPLVPRRIPPILRKISCDPPRSRYPLRGALPSLAAAESFTRPNSTEHEHGVLLRGRAPPRPHRRRRRQMPSRRGGPARAAGHLLPPDRPEVEHCRPQGNPRRPPAAAAAGERGWRRRHLRPGSRRPRSGGRY